MRKLFLIYLLLKEKIKTIKKNHKLFKSLWPYLHSQSCILKENILRKF